MSETGSDGVECSDIGCSVATAATLARLRLRVECLEDESITVVQQSIGDGIGEGGLVDVSMPLIDGKLARDQPGLLVVTVFEDFELASA